MALDANIVIDFSENIDASASAVTVECPAATPITGGFAGLPQANVNQLTINPTNALPGNTTCTVTVVALQVNDADGNDPPDNMAANFVSTFTTVPEPAAINDTYTVSTHLEITTTTANGVLANDTNTTAGTTVFGVGATAAAAQGVGVTNTNSAIATAQGGTVNVQTNGSFVYNPPADFTGNDTFFYTLTDSGFTSTAAEVTLTVSGTKIWFVDSAAAGPTFDGTARNPFQQLVGGGNDFDGNASDDAGDIIFVDGGAYTCGLTLLDNQTLVGDGASTNPLNTELSLTFDANTTAGLVPTLSGTDSTFTSTSNCITLANGNNVRGISIGNTGAGNYAFVDSAAASTNTVTDTSITGTGGLYSITNTSTFNATFNETSSSGSGAVPAIRLTNAAGTITNSTASSIATNTTGNNLVDINGGTVNLTYTGTLSKTNTGRIANAINRTAGAVDFQGNLTCNGGCTGINVEQRSTGGTTTFSGGTKTLNTGASAAVTLATNGGHTINFTNGGLAITTTTTGTGFSATGGGTVNVTGTANTIGATTASQRTALNISDTTIGTSNVTFQEISVDAGTTGGDTTAIILDDSGAGIFNVNDSSNRQVRENIATWRYD